MANTNIMQQSEDHFILDTEDFEPGPECCIYKVPQCLREVKEAAYTPRLISIGPIHHGKQNLAKMNRQKQRYLKKFFEKKSEKTLKNFQSFIKENIKRIYRCYDEFAFETKFETSEFENMVLNDAVFIIELFRRCDKGRNDFLLKRKWLDVELRTDLLLLENQLPFFVLEGLYDLAFDSSTDLPSFLDVTYRYFDFGEDLYYEGEIKHFTDLARRLLIMNHPSNYDGDDRVYSATKLHVAGVAFKAAECSDAQFDINVKFEKGELRIPTLCIIHWKEVMIRNLMALEQCHYPERAYVCGYINLLDYLVDIDEDVDLLVKKGIFLNGMGSSAAVANTINSMMLGVEQISTCYSKIHQDLNQHYDNYWNRTKATLRHVYFNNLWKGTATIAAFLVVLLTLTQTLLAIAERAMPTK